MNRLENCLRHMQFSKGIPNLQSPQHCPGWDTQVALGTPGYPGDVGKCR